jgi:hypothetical protein
MQSNPQTTTSKKSAVAPKKDKKTLSTKASEQQKEEVVQEVKPNTVQPPVQPPVPPAVELAPTQELDYNNVLDFFNTTSDKFTEYSKYFKDNSLNKEERLKLETAFKKFVKSFSVIQLAYFESLSRQVSSLEKNNNSKSGGTKKVTDKEKSAIHKKLNVQPFLLTFMKLEPGTLVSRSDALTAITSYVKASNPSIIVENDKGSFKLVGDLAPLFTGICNIMKSKNLIQENPTQIRYTQIMQYMTHCFIKDEPTA